MIPLPDHKQLINAVDHLINVDCAVNTCPDCKGGVFCDTHAKQYVEAMKKLRKVAGRGEFEPN